MDKQAAEKFASDYYNLGLEIALQESGMGQTKTASRRRQIAKMLGIGGAGVLGGAGLAKLLSPQAERAAIQLADMSPGRFVDEVGAAAKSRLAKMNYQADEIMKNVDLNNINLFDGDMSLPERAAAAIKSVREIPDMSMINYDGGQISKLDALNYLNPFATRNVYNMDTLRGMGLVD